jgi:hypothetical protein
MTPPTDTPRTIPLIGTAIRSFSPGRDKPPKLIGEIGCLEVGNWRDQPYIPEIKLDSLMTQEVVKLWIKQFTRDESISLADQTYLKPAYIFENLRKTLAALILSGKERAIVHFCRQRDSDYKLPISRQDLVGIADLADSSFYFHQFKFIAPKIEEGMPVSISMNHILPIRQRELIGGGTFSEVSKIQIDEHQDGITAKRTSRESVGRQGLTEPSSY